MASAGTRAAAAAALIFSVSAAVFLFLLPQALPPGLAVAELVASALDRFLDGRGGLLELATRRNMILHLLCHAILLLILRDAGVLGAPASRRSRSCPRGEATAAPARPHATRSAVVAPTACSATPAQPYATRSAVVGRRRQPRNRAVVAPVHEHDAPGRVVVECRPAVHAAVATQAAPVLTTGPAAARAAGEAAAAAATKQMVVVEESRRDADDVRAAAVEPLEHPTAIAADGERDECDDHRTFAVADDDTAREHQTAGMEVDVEVELADDRTFEEFIEGQRRQMRQESLQQLVESGCHYHYHYHYQAIATCN